MGAVKYSFRKYLEKLMSSVQMKQLISNFFLELKNIIFSFRFQQNWTNKNWTKSKGATVSWRKEGGRFKKGWTDIQMQGILMSLLREFFLDFGFS